jgi:FkbM family methyltransferase
MKTFCSYFLIVLSISLYADLENDSIQSAKNLNSSGEQLFIGYLSEKDKEIYNFDSDYIEKFPISSYRSTHVKNLGTFFIDKENDTIKKHLFEGRIWESTIVDVIKKCAKPGITVLDIGAHIGTHSITMSKIVGKSGKVLAFEPNMKIYAELCYNLSANNIQNVYPLRLAVGKESGIITTVTPLSTNEGGTFVIKTDSLENASFMLRLDDLNLNNVSFIKIDVENMEADVIDGAIKTIKRCSPILLIEIQGNQERPSLLNENSVTMAKISKKKLMDLNYKLIQVTGIDYLCLPINKKNRNFKNNQF